LVWLISIQETIKQRMKISVLERVRPNTFFRWATLSTLLVNVIYPVHAQRLEGAVIEQQQLQRQQERERELRERMAPQADTLHSQTKPAVQEIPQDESPCFALHAIELTGEKLEQVSWLQDSSGIDLSSKPCIGAKGVEVILARMQQAVLEHGYVTSRVLVVPQSLKSGILTVAFIPGVLRDVRFSPESTGDTSLFTALPSQRGELLQLRDIEQGLENFKRVPTADADIQITPAEGPDVAPGQSDLVISYKKIRPLRVHGGCQPGLQARYERFCCIACPRGDFR
jgi:hemolysin activation/secretion protein